MSYPICLFRVFNAFGIDIFKDRVLYENNPAGKIDKYNPLN